jgi:hypothetical protein
MIHQHWRAFAVVVAILHCAGSANAQPVTTVITHGYSLDGSKGAWIEGMADAIIARAVAEGASGGAVCRYDQASGAWQLVSGTLSDDEPVCLIYRWLQDFDKPGPDWGFAEGAADALYAALRDASFMDAGGQAIEGVELVAGRDLHFLGHSRGVIVNSEVVERFAVAGIVVDHVTGFDPHPMDGTLDWPVNYDWGDPMPRRWSNIVFHDNYWRADGGIFNAADPDGIPIAGAFNVELNESALNCCGYGTAHSDVHLWYHGTIDLAPFPCDGEQCITQTMRNTWWPGGYTEVGFYYSVIGGGAALRPAQGASVQPGFVSWVYGGSFEQTSQAGWQFHGGMLSGAVVSEGGVTFLKLGPSQGTSATHNRFLLPADASAVTLSVRVLVPDSIGLDDVLRANLIDGDGVATELPGAVDLTQQDAGWVSASFFIPAAVARETVQRLQFVLSGGGGAVVHATVGIDDIDLAFEIAPPCPADMVSNTTFAPPGDGVVDGADLAFLLGAWGRNAGSPADMVSNVTFAPPPDGVVDAADLAFLLGAWGACE